MRRLLGLAVIALAAVSPALAQENSHRTLAERVVKAVYEQKIADRIMEVFWPVALEAIKQRAPGVTPVQIFQYENKTMALAGAAAHNGLVPLVDYFDHVYSDDELTAIAAFYESGPGAKLNRAEAAIAGVLQGAAGKTLNAEVNALRIRLDELLKADGF